MPWTRKYTIIAAVAIAIVAILAVAWWLGGTGPVSKSPETPQADGTQPPPVPLLRKEGEPTPQAPSGLEQTAAAPAAAARSVLERYGSWSSASDLANFQEVLPSLTSGMQQRARAMAASLRQQYPASGPFYSQQLKVVQLSRDVNQAAPDRVVVQSTAQLAVRKGAMAESITYPVYRLTLVKQGEEWLVDAIEQVKS